jgi:dynein heavy chain
MGSCDLKQMQVTTGYGLKEWREDVKQVLMSAGTETRQVCFVVSDAQLFDESMVEDISSLLNTGQIPALFNDEELESLADSVRALARTTKAKHKLKFGSSNNGGGEGEGGDFVDEEAYLTVHVLIDFFWSRVKANLHIVLTMSPIGDVFRQRLRLFPSLVCCTTVDWFQPWSHSGLVAVAERYIDGATSGSKDGSDGNKDGSDSKVSRRARALSLHHWGDLAQACADIHISVGRLNADYMHEARRVNYCTPTAFLFLVRAFQHDFTEQTVRTGRETERDR